MVTGLPEFPVGTLAKPPPLYLTVITDTVSDVSLNQVGSPAGVGTVPSVPLFRFRGEAYALDDPPNETTVVLLQPGLAHRKTRRDITHTRIFILSTGLELFLLFTSLTTAFP